VCLSQNVPFEVLMRRHNQRVFRVARAVLRGDRDNGFFHDGRFAMLLDVVNHYDQVFGLGLTESEKRDLVEYIKSL
jgi:hypothetical protein